MNHCQTSSDFYSILQGEIFSSGKDLSLPSVNIQKPSLSSVFLLHAFAFESRAFNGIFIPKRFFPAEKISSAQESTYKSPRCARFFCFTHSLMKAELSTLLRETKKVPPSAGPFVCICGSGEIRTLVQIRKK